MYINLATGQGSVYIDYRAITSQNDEHHLFFSKLIHSAGKGDDSPVQGSEIRVQGVINRYDYQKQKAQAKWEAKQRRSE